MLHFTLRNPRFTIHIFAATMYEGVTLCVAQGVTLLWDLSLNTRMRREAVVSIAYYADPSL